MGCVAALFRALPGAGEKGGGGGFPQAVHTLRPKDIGSGGRGVPALLRGRAAGQGSGLSSGNGVGIPSGGILSGIPEGERLLRGVEGLCGGAAGEHGGGSAGGLYRPAAGDL